ncbi:hypothetical protein SAMN04515692_108101 [Leifsonia sp. CL147]|nr:hypothetical protein SAMN04515694_10835 [Leifsonia sp. CL154]SFL63956.1 hypothetical protein SAMN04515692_108101 [Leifsonia sp. CL147]
MNACWIGLLIRWGAPGKSTTGLRNGFKIYQSTNAYSKSLLGGHSSPEHSSSPNQNTWGEEYVVEQAKVGHTYRHGPVVIRVLGTWQSSKSADDRRGYLHVSFDEGEIVCPPLPADTVEVAGQ